MLILTLLVALALFGVLGPRLMGRVDRFLSRGGFSGREAAHHVWTGPARDHQKSA